MELAAGGPAQTVSGEVSHPLGDTVDRVVYVVGAPPESPGPVVLRVGIACRFVGDRQFIVRVDGVAFSQHCGTTIDVPLEADGEAGAVSGEIHLSAPGLGPARVEWTLTLSVVAGATSPG